MLTSNASLLKLQPEWWGKERVQCLRKNVQTWKVQSISQRLLKLMCIESVMPSNHLILCRLAVTLETHEEFWYWENPKVPLCFSLFSLYRYLWRRRQWHPTPVLLPGKPHGWRSLEGCSPWGRWRSDTTERIHFHFSLSCIGEGNGNPLQCSCLENPRDGGAWWVAIYGVAQSRTWLKRLSSSSSSSSSWWWWK